MAQQAVDNQRQQQQSFQVAAALVRTGGRFANFFLHFTLFAANKHHHAIDAPTEGDLLCS